MPELHHSTDAATEHLPVMEDGRRVATKELPVVTEPIAVVQAPPQVAPAPPQVVPAPPQVVAPPPRRRSRSKLAAGMLAFVVLGGAAGAAVATALRSDVASPSPSTSPSASAKAKVLTASVSSVDPSGGSGLRHQGGRWQTQIYRTADFGNLKPGVGLLLDLGSPHSVSSVRFDAGPGPITVQLRAGDQASSGPASFTATGSSTSAHGPTTLDGMPGGKHRYWLVWISQLAATPGGYSAVVSDPVVHGSS